MNEKIEDKPLINDIIIRRLSNLYCGASDKRAQAINEFITENYIDSFRGLYVPPWEKNIRIFLYRLIEYYLAKKQYYVVIDICDALQKAAPKPVFTKYRTALIEVYYYLFDLYNTMYEERKGVEDMSMHRTLAEKYCNLYDSLNSFMGCLYQNIEFNENNTKLGEGAFSQVFIGKYIDNGIAEDVAIKTMKFDEDSRENVCKSFSNEIDILLKLNHPNIIPLRAYYRDPDFDKILLIFKLLKENLSKVLYTKGIILYSLRLRWALQIAKAINYLHSEGILHRDIKSSNIMLDENQNAVIIDFNLAIQKSYVTRNDRSGTLFWTAPEILKKEGGSEASDIYSYGMLTYEIIARKLPFNTVNLIGSTPENQREDFLTYISAHGVEQPIPEKTPSAFAALIKRCWAERSQRPTAQEICQELEDLATTIGAR